jgi:hypothetical protein
LTISKEAVSDEHQRLVRALIDKFTSDGLEIVEAAYEGYPQPQKEGWHEPDIRAFDKANGLIVIGEAKRCDDLTSDRTKEQFQDFASRIMAKGKSEQQAIPFHVITPKKCENELLSLLEDLGILKKPNVFRWTMR